MVGFGSSLRMARRAGWERAYLDYETLKLLLSQIESVYEEEWHRQRTEDDVFEDIRPRRKRRKIGAHDYRDELFLESDSDKAFASSASDLLDHDSETDEEQALGDTAHSKPFTLSYSQDTVSLEGDDDSQDFDANCGAGGLVGWSRRENKTVLDTAKKSRKKQKRRSTVSPLRDHHSDFFVGGHDAFLIEGSGTAGASSLLNTSVQPGFDNENTALLQQPQLEDRDTFYSFDRRGKTLTPPQDFSAGAFYPSVAVGVNHHKKPQAPPILPRQKQADLVRQRLEAERRRKRRQRRRRRQAKKRRELERKVPPHLRLAHNKARSITERFLGLLRAEVEKVTLFAQSRLGELADTAGSLRFPSCDDSEFGSFSSRHARASHGRGGYDHPLSDGGMHPSASSSEDEHGGIFPWSDTSDEDKSEAGSNRGTSPLFGTNRPKRTSSTAKNASANLKSSATNERATGESSVPSQAKNTAFAAAQRQISQFTRLRCERPTFQRNDHIVGDDLLLLSAVDEADGYTAVGVELMHVLRFICVNVIAVRKICKKHDRLLMNRMLGGYYHRKRKRKEQGNDEKGGGRQHFFTLGNLVSRSLGEDCDVDPAAETGRNQNKLVGVFDRKVQDLANSPTVKVVSSCLALALSEYEVSQSRANALSKLNSVASRAKTPQKSGSVGFDDSLPPPPASPGETPFGLSPSRWLKRDKNLDSKYKAVEEETTLDPGMDSEPDGPPSTASTISLTRLRFTVVSIFALREAARFKLDFHKRFLCRSLLVCNGRSIPGEGLDGCSRETLDFLVSYNPDAALLLDSSALYDGLHQGNWRVIPIGRIMLTSLSMAVVSPVFGASSVCVEDAVSILPSLSVEVPFESASPAEGLASGYDETLLKLSRFSCMLNSMNYYIVHATANTFVRFTGAHPAYSANIIGAASVTALLATFYQCYRLSKEPYGKETSAVSLRRPFLFAALAGIVGNGVYVAGIARASILSAVAGRLLIGLSSTDILHQHVICNCVPAGYVVPESAHLVNSKVYGRVLGLGVGALLGSVNVSFFGPRWMGMGAFAWVGYLMSFLWVVHGLRLLVKLPRPMKKMRDRTPDKQESEGNLSDAQSLSEEFSSDQSENELKTPDSVLQHSSSDLTRDELEATYNAEQALLRKRVSNDDNEATNEIVGKRSRFRAWKTLLKRLRKFFLYNVTLPITLVIVVLVTASHEVLFTSCGIITYRYFRWSGNLSALFLCMLSLLVLLINRACGALAKTYDERSVIKRCIFLIGGGVLVIVNYASLFSLAAQIENILDETDQTDEAHFIEVHPYDWMMGIYQYVIGFAVIFVGITTLEGAALSLMSKVAPPRKSVVVNCGTLVTFASFAARVLADINILFVGLSHRLINTDIVNSLAIPILLAFVAVYYIVKKHFFFLL